MDKVAAFSIQQRRELFQETAARRNLAAPLVEKDFWVCWTLLQLFTIPSLRGHIVFKGGTSLSKVFGAIQRFSEDIDLIIDYEMLGFSGDRQPSKTGSRSKHIALLKEMLESCSRYIEGPFLDELRTRYTSILGPDGWELRTRRMADGSAVVEYVYPAAFDERIDYVAPHVLLEPGTHAEFIPKGEYDIRAFAAEEFPQLFTQPTARLQAITAERTFWEKATILHAEHHRPLDKSMPGRHSRHYYDLTMLAGTDICRRAIADVGLRERVVRHKTEFYYSQWARYDLAVPGSIRLVPRQERIAQLERDYENMKVMLFGTAPPFQAILRTLSALEADLNAGPSPLSN
jgi:hypothetical protein